MERDAAFCFPCRFFGVWANPTFICTGFRDWKNAKGQASGILKAHQNTCGVHHNANLSWEEYKATVAGNSSVAVQIQRGRLRTIEDNRVYIKSITEVYCSVVNRV